MTPNIKGDINRKVPNKGFWIIIIAILTVPFALGKIFSAQNQTTLVSQNSKNNFQNSAPVYNGPVTNNYIQDTTKREVIDSNKKQTTSNTSKTDKANISYSVKSDNQQGGQTANTINNNK